MSRVRIALAALIGLAIGATHAPAQQAREPFPGLDAYVDAARRAWKVPGIAIAIVRNDSLLYTHGYGVRDLGTGVPVDANTVFAIGSASKAFTAALVAMLADEKRVSLDGHVTDYLPGFQMFDPYVTREMTVRDLLSHRSGLARGELAWYGSANDRDEIVRRVRFLEPSWSFRSQFGYQNIMYITAGQVVARATGASWDDLVRQRILTPLGMRATTTSTTALTGLSDLASPHADVSDTVRVVERRNIDNAAAAGSINSTVIDMARWVRLQLGDGSFDGKRLVSARMLDEMHSPQMVIRLDTAARRLNPFTHFSSYGLGWFLQDYRGRSVVQHGGNIDGFSALVAMMPEERFGIVILTNMNGTGVPTALMNRIFDMQLGAAPRDWSALMLARTETSRVRARAAQQKVEAARAVGTKPTLPIAAYAGTYSDSLYGDVVIREEGGKLLLTYGPTWHGTLEHWQYDTFRTRFSTPVLPPVMIQFHLNPAAKVDEVQLDLAGIATFRRRPDRPAAGATQR